MTFSILVSTNPPHGVCANCVGGQKYAIRPSDATFMNALCIYNATIFVGKIQHTEAHNEEQFAMNGRWWSVQRQTVHGMNINVAKLL